MASISERPIVTDVYDRAGHFRPDAGSSYLFGESSEARSSHVSCWRADSGPVSFGEIVDENANSLRIEIDDSARDFSLRSERQLSDLWSSLPRDPVYLDITGLPHHVWAPLLKTALVAGRELRVVYVEPEHYTVSPTPVEGQIFDLSERISGIAPIPGFASLTDENEDDVCFVPLLGFEGSRLLYVIEAVQPPGRKVYPVIGVPGFKPEYPFYAYHANRSVLKGTRSWSNVHLAAADCPFSVWFLLHDISEKHPQDLIKVAPIGTKPHALGAVLFAITSRRTVELVYDHPIRKPGRTVQAGRLHCYHISKIA